MSGLKPGPISEAKATASEARATALEAKATALEAKATASEAGATASEAKRRRVRGRRVVEPGLRRFAWPGHWWCWAARGGSLIYNRGLSNISTGRIVGAVLQLKQGQDAGSGKPREMGSADRRAAGISEFGAVSMKSVAGVGRAAAGLAGVGLVAVALAGCGNTYRPVVSAINPVGPAGQPQKYAVAVSSPSPTANGLLTLVDFAGDSVLVTPSLGVNPYYFVLSSSGTTGYTLNSDKTVNSFDVSSSLITSQVLETTLLPGSNPVSLFATSSASYMPDPGLSAIDQLSGTPPALKQELPVATNPVYVVGVNGAPRVYAISQGTGTAAGQAAAIETGANTISTTIPVGRGPVYGVMTSDYKRAFILNQTDGTVTAINAITNALDQPVLPNPIAVGVRPVWADLVATKNEMVVANEGTGTSIGSLSIISIPLCSPTTLAGNAGSTCDTTNPVDASAFGTVLATVPVGVNPIMVTALSDGTRAYVANAGVASLPCSPTGLPLAGYTTCSVSVVNLTSLTVTATIPINGHPAYIASTNSTPTGKVYVVCKDSQVMTVIETDTDSLDTTIPLQGFGVSVRVTAP
jgi:DNA-binding beta-propeller fold protein YncE